MSTNAVFCGVIRWSAIGSRIGWLVTGCASCSLGVGRVARAYA
jgi:hypothetical protein